MIKEEVLVDEIRKDLRDIKFYYSYRKDLLEAVKIIYENELVYKIDLYNKIMAKAPIKLYHLYYGLFILGYTQKAFSDKMCYSVEYISMLNSMLIAYLQVELNKK